MIRVAVVSLLLAVPALAGDKGEVKPVKLEVTDFMASRERDVYSKEYMKVIRPKYVGKQVTGILDTRRPEKAGAKGYRVSALLYGQTYQVVDGKPIWVHGGAFIFNFGSDEELKPGRYEFQARVKAIDPKGFVELEEVTLKPKAAP
jgi:hypothetical protein